MIRRFVALAIALLVVVAFAGVGAAAGPLELGVGPGAFTVRSVDPANAVEETINVVNLSDEGMSVVVTLTDLAMSAAGAFSSVEPGTGLPSAAAWGKAEPATFQLPRGHVQMVKITFTPPANATPGGFYAATRVVGTASGGASTRSIHATLLDVRGAGVVRAGKIADISVPSPSFGSTLPVKLRLENTGNVYAVASGRLVVRDMRSQITATVTIGKTPVIPGTPRILEINVPAPAFPGRVRVSADLDFGAGVPKDSATATIFAFAWWHLVSAVVVLFVLVRLLIGIVRWRRRRKLMKPHKAKREKPQEKAPVTVGDIDLQSDWERSREAAPVTPRKAAPVVTQPPPAPEPIVPALVTEEEPEAVESMAEEDFWAPKSDVHTPMRIPPAEPRAAQIKPDEPPARAASSVPKLADLISLQRPAEEPEPVEPEEEERLEAMAEPEPEPEPEPQPEPEPEPEPETAVVVPIVRSKSKPEEPAPIEESDQPAARVHQLSEMVRAGVPATRPSGPQAARRRVKVAVDMLATGSGRSAERLDVAVQLLASAGGDVVAAVEESFDSAAAAGRAGSMGSLALALALLDSPRAAEALLRAYAVAPRSTASALREALKSCDPDVVKTQSALLEALPQDRRKALKLA